MPFFRIIINVEQFSRQKPVGLHLELVRRTVIDAQCMGTPTNIYVKLFPRKGLLEDPMVRITRKEKGVSSLSVKGGEKSQLRYANVLCLNHNDKIERLMFAFCKLSC